MAQVGYQTTYSGEEVQELLDKVNDLTPLTNSEIDALLT